MSWASDRLQYLNQQYSYREIQDFTGIPISTISYVIRDQMRLSDVYRLPLRRAYSRTIYASLRASGLSPNIARNISWGSVSKAEEWINESKGVVNQIAQSRFEQYKDFLIRSGRYVDDETTAQILRDSITKALAKSPIDTDEFKGKDSPSLRHVVIIDSE